MIRKIFYRLALLCALLFAWTSSGYALQLPCDFSRTFDSGKLTWHPFSVVFHYDSEVDSLYQHDFSGVIVGGNSYSAPGSRIGSKWAGGNGIRVAGIGGFDHDYGLWKRIAFFDGAAVGHSQAPLFELITGGVFGFYDIAYGSAYINDVTPDSNGGQAPIPEPASLLLLGGGLLGLARFHRKKVSKR